jgi:tetratricopeptide (TPR) repeat protein
MNLTLAQAGGDCAEQTQDWRHLVILRALQGAALDELGDHEGAEHTLRELAKLAERIREPMVLSCSAAYLASHLSLRSDREPLDEAVQLARAAIAVRQVNPFIFGQLHYSLARALMKQGALDEAAAAARSAGEILAMSPTERTCAVTVLLQILLRQGHASAAEALVIAEKALQDLRAARGVGYAEVAFHVTLAEVRHAVGDASGARGALEEAGHQMTLRAEKIPDLAARERYLHHVAENIRIRELTRLWRSAEASNRP